MSNYFFKRLIAMPFLILGIVTIAFALTTITKGDPLTSIVAEQQMNNPEVVAAAKAKWGLDRSLPERYFIYLKNLAVGDMGTSFVTKRPVGTDLMARLPATMELVVVAMILGSVIGITLGILAAYYRDSVIDHLARLFALFGSSLPVFWLGLAVLFVFSVQFEILPGPGRLDPRMTPPAAVTGFMTIDSLLAGDGAAFRDALAHLIPPSLVLGWAVAGTISRLVRAKGAGELRVVFRHALRNILVPVLTVISYSFAYLITGAVLTETIFAWPGLGSYAVEAARALDFPAIIGVTIVGGIMFLMTNLLTDIAYVLANPRVRLG
ncbi:MULTISPECIES: ABC transporter permease [unclassified Brucella]|uniref:ABC transporter permease n=1 Tax=unclassified Brucella TaxID=2632610 RepID=UPI000D030968|nr:MULTISPECIES: ABC transporter permease [unclassified Brucella]